MNCINCDFSIKIGGNFCGNCGMKVEPINRCFKCDTINKKGAKFCGSCGNDLNISSKNIKSFKLKVENKDISHENLNSKKEMFEGNPLKNENRKSEKFNKKEELYKPIRITIIVLTTINAFLEASYAGYLGKAFNPFPIIITYFLLLNFMRYIYRKNKSFNYKVLITISIFVLIYILKLFLGFIILSALF